MRTANNKVQLQATSRTARPFDKYITSAQWLDYLLIAKYDASLPLHRIEKTIKLYDLPFWHEVPRNLSE